MPDALEEEVRHIPGVTSVDTMRFFNTHVGERPVVVVSREFPDREPPIALYPPPRKKSIAACSRVKS